jgi:CheY-like chemotaxis protein
MGMDEKTRQHCMEPFFSTKALRGGTGLGLAMVYGMMQRHEGTIEIDSAPGCGTRIRLTFPVREKIPQAPSSDTSFIKQDRALRILCIDDEPKLQKLLRNCLTNFSHQVSVAPTGQYGLEMFRAAVLKKKPYDVVITDLGMPDIDGHEVARVIKLESPQTPVVMMTGWEMIMKEDGETAPEVDALIGKPPRIKELNNLLLRLTAQDRETQERKKH